MEFKGILIMKRFEEKSKHAEFIIRSVKKDLVSLIPSKFIRLGLVALLQYEHKTYKIFTRQR